MQVTEPVSPLRVAAPESKHTCFHCHDTCPDDHFKLQDKYFCCNGCKTVYEILDTNNLCDYYTLDAKAGQTLKKQRNAQAYAYLDDPEVEEKLIEFSNGTVSQTTFYLPQMHCVSCIWLLENLGRLDSGVVHSRVNFLKKTNTIQFDPKVTSLRKLAALLASIGYEPEINLGDVDGKKAAPVSKKLALQIGVAGFAFGNIMLFSFPEYVGMDAATFRWYANIFGYLSLVLALPVLLFSARDYFISAWQGLRSFRLNIDIPLCLALGALFGRSVWEIMTHTGAGYLDSFAGLTFLLLIGRWFQQRTWNRLSFERDYKSYFPVAATVRTGDSETTVPVNRLVPGDIILVRSQEIIPADGILLKGEARIDYSFVTGEADPVPVNSGDRIFAGGKQLGAAIEISLTRRVSQSHLTKLWNNEAFKTPDEQWNRSSVSSLADQAGRFFSWLILAVGGGAFLFWWLVRGDMHTAINAFTAVMIVACPCTVALSIPFTLGNIVRIMGRQRFYLKNNQVVESLAAFNAVVFDKTGTITNVAQQQVQFKGGTLGYDAQRAVKSLVQHSSHPLSRQIHDTLSDITTLPVAGFEEFAGNGIRGKVKDSLGNILNVKVGSAAFTGAINTQNSGVFVSIDDQILGYFEMKSRYRDGLEDVLGFLRGKDQANSADIYLVSGDQDREARALTPFFPEQGAMHFNCSPQDKLDFVEGLQKQGRHVMMIGDGLNDAGALRQSQTGIVVAEDTNNFTPACEAIVHASEFGRMPAFIQLARDGVRIVRQSYGVALLYNAIGLSYAVMGNLSPLVAAILMPTSSISIVLFGVFMSNWAARRRGLSGK